MDTLPTAEGALQQEQFQKLVKDCSKSTYIELFNEICNLQRDLVVEQDETISNWQIVVAKIQEYIGKGSIRNCSKK